MSYRNDMERLCKERDAQRSALIRLIKITVIALAAAILVTAIAAGPNHYAFLLDDGSLEIRFHDGRSERYERN